MSGSGLRFECTQCGKCCVNRGEYAYVYLNRDEVKALAQELGIGVRAFRRRYTFRDEDGWTQLRREGNACVFLDPETNACGVYEARPIQCRTFPFWRSFVEDGKWTDEVRTLCEGIGRGPIHASDEVERHMREMEQSEED